MARVPKTAHAKRRAAFREAGLMEPVSYGAIEALRPKHGIGRGPFLETSELFNEDLLSKTKERLSELGLLSLLDPSVIRPLLPRDVHRAVEQALGVDRADAEDYDAAENEAWFLISFLWLHLRANLYEIDTYTRLTEWRLSALIDLGRLLEWWRWRREGHDFNAARHAGVRRIRSERATEQWSALRTGRQAVFREIEVLIERGRFLGPVTRDLVKQGKFKGSPAALERAYRRWKRGR